MITYFVVDYPSTWYLSHSSMDLDTLEFTHVEWLHAFKFLEGTFHVDTWNFNWLYAFFGWCVPFMSIIWCILLLFLDERKLIWRG
jgi:hypothetical protein